MGKKTKAIQKEEKSEKPVVKVKAKKSQSAAQVDIFTASFHQRLNQFKELTKQILTKRAEINSTDPSDEIESCSKSVAQNIQNQTSKILKHQLSSLQNWIIEQQNSIQEEIKKINEAYEINRTNLKSTGAFTEDEIKNQLAPIKKRQQEKQDTFDQYQSLLDRSKNVYE